MVATVIYVSFSGGETSGYMSKRLLDIFPREQLTFMFANTGAEHPRTLDFVNECDVRWGLNLVWLEAVVDPRKRFGTSHRVVTYESASRKGEPFENVISKYGIPNKPYPHCSRELKTRPMRSFVRANSPRGDFQIAIGMRSDEIDRQAVDAKRKRYIYPMIGMFPTFKSDVKAFWATQDFGLNLPEHLGNCVFCWKKSDRKLGMVVREQPGWFDFAARMEQTYSMRNSNQPRTFFRSGRSALQMVAQYGSGAVGSDEHDGCSESCEPL